MTPETFEVYGVIRGTALNDYWEGRGDVVSLLIPTASHRIYDKPSCLHVKLLTKLLRHPPTLQVYRDKFEKHPDGVVPWGLNMV